MKCIIVIVLYIFISNTSLAQEKKWGLDECMRYAVEKSPQKLRQDEQNKIYKQNYIEEIGKLLPTLGANSNVSWNFGRGINDETNTYSNNNSISNSYGLNTSLTLFDGFSNINRIQFQKVNKLLGKQQLQQVIDFIAYETMNTYFNVLYYKELTKVAEKQLEESSHELRKVKKMVELGLKSEADIADILVKEATDRYNVTVQNNSLTIAIIKLKEFMNYPMEDDIQILKDEEYLIVSRKKEAALDIFEQSKSYNPKAQSAEISLKAQSLSYKITKGSLFPSIHLNAGYSTNFFRSLDGSTYNSFSKQFGDKMSKYIGFTISVPIFNGFSRSTQLKRSKAYLTMQKYEYEETMQTLYSEIEQAIADMNGKAEEYYQAEQQLNAVNIAHNINKRKYDEGLLSAIELHTSSNRVLQAETDVLSAKLQYQLKSKLVNYYKGEPFIK